MPKLNNPFHEMYVTETISPWSFVSIFSPVLLQDSLLLFQPGNVILKGVQGSGKSMLLNLLKPEIRVAYAQADVPFPVPSQFSRFIGAGINLTRSGALDLGQRQIETDPDEDLQILPRHFADFLNYWIVRDMLSSINKLAAAVNGRIANELKLKTTLKILDRAARTLKSDPCWFGYLDGVDGYAALQARLETRIRCYRDFMNFNISELPNELRRTRTSVGEPIAQAVQALWDAGVVPDDVPFFIRIDQYEELAHLEEWSSERDLYLDYRGVVNKVLGGRDRRVSYRIGGRTYSLSELRMFGTTAVLEKERNYKIVDLDNLLRRKEHTRGWPFKRFAEDVFRLRIAQWDPVASKRSHLLRRLLGRAMTPEEESRSYARNSTSNVIQLEKSWPKDVRTCLTSLLEENPYDAKLGEAWVRQQLARPDPVLPRLGEELPWHAKQKKWWRKERRAQAMLQIAAARRQRLVWAGAETVLSLAGGNILVFVSMCQFIWGAWLRSVTERTGQSDVDMPRDLDVSIQTEGIEEASQYWYDRIQVDPNGDARKRFVGVLGETFRAKLVKDERMSYPGSNGFSLPVADLPKDSEVERQLQDCVDFGALFDRPHTPKSRKMGPRRKWYLNPVLSPTFQIPIAHTKEPMYVSIDEVRKWLESAEVLPRQPRGKQKRRRDDSQLDLFGDDAGAEQ